MKINDKKELQNITRSHSADIDYQDFMKIYRECTEKPFNFLTIDTTLPASDPLRSRKICLILIKMTVTDQLEILDRKILKKEAQYDLDRKAAKMSTLSSNNPSKYEYLTSEDLGLKPSTVEQAKFECSPLGKIFNKEPVEDDDKKERLLKRLLSIMINLLFTGFIEIFKTLKIAH